MDFFSWDRFFTAFPKILPSMGVTLNIVAVVTVIGTVWGILLAMVQIRKIPVLCPLSKIYVSFFRGTSMLVQLLLIYYGLPKLVDSIFGTDLNQSLGKIFFVYITFILNEGAFLSAVFYGAITSVNVGQLEAGYSVGMTKNQVYRRIILPQAVRTALPPFGSDLVALFQSTTLVYYIGVTDVLGRARALGAARKHYLEAYLAVAVIFVIVSGIIRLAFARLNESLNYGRDRNSAVKKGEQEVLENVPI